MKNEERESREKDRKIEAQRREGEIGIDWGRALSLLEGTDQ